MDTNGRGLDFFAHLIMAILVAWGLTKFAAVAWNLEVKWWHYVVAFIPSGLIFQFLYDLNDDEL